MRSKYVRELKRIFTNLGIEVLEMYTNGSGHMCVVARKGDLTRKVHVAGTPGDNRANKNIRTDVSKAFRQ